MTHSIKRLAVLVGAFAILALALAAVGPVLAQEGTGGQDGQTGNAVALEAGDTLGSLVNRYNLTDDNLRLFFSQNWDLVLEDNQTVVYPADVDVNFDADVQDFVDVDVEGRQTYTTQQGDTLGQVFGFTGFVRTDTGAGMVGGNVVPTPTLDANAAGTMDDDVAATPAAGAGTTDGDMESTPAAGDDMAATPAAGDTTGTVGDTGMTGQQGADLTDTQLEAFLEANEDLTFVEDQMVMFPAGVPITGGEMTGQDAQATPTLAAGDTGDTGADAETTPTGEETTAEGVTADITTYTVQLGDTLTSIAAQFGVTVEQLVEMNPDLVQPGSTINVPAQQGSIPQTGSDAGQVDSTPTVAVDDVMLATPTLEVDEPMVATPTLAAGDTTGQVDATPTTDVDDAMQATPTPAAADTTEATPTATAATGDVVEATPTATAATGDVVEATPTATAAAGDVVEATPTATAAAGDTAQPTATPAGTTGIPETGQQDDVQAQNLVTICTGDAPSAPAGFGKYRYRGESLQFLAEQTNSTVENIIALNGADAFIRGNIITLPGAEAPGLWKNELLRDCTTVDITRFQQQGQVPQTGGDAGQTQATPAPAGTTGIPQTGQQGVAQNPNLVTVCTGDAASARVGFGKYRYRGESLQFLAEQTNSTVENIIALNGANAFIRGNIITLPGAEAPGLWNNQLLRDCTTVDVTRFQQGEGE